MVERSSFMHQIEPGSQTEQAPPSAFLQLTPEELHGFRFLTISVAPHPVIPSFLFSFLLFSYMVDLNCQLLYKKMDFFWNSTSLSWSICMNFCTKFVLYDMILLLQM